MTSEMLAALVGAEFPPIDNNVLATVAAILGGLGVKFIDRWASKKNTNTTFIEAERIRSELRIDNDRLHDERQTLRSEIDILENENHSLKMKLHDYMLKHPAPLSDDSPSI